MKKETTLFNARHLALMHGLSINPTPRHTVEPIADDGENPRPARRRSRLWLVLLFGKLFPRRL
jgi:hypothetical protein